MNVTYRNRWYQDEAEFSIFNYFNAGGVGNPVVAMPTGTGKSVVIANFIRNIFAYWPNQRVIMLTHVKKLIQQNAEKLMSVWPVAPMGVYSAGLNSRDMIMPIVFGGVQSVSKAIARSLKETDDNRPPHLKHFGWRDLVLIDECHLLGPDEDTQYQYVIAELKKINPYLKVVGFTATPYRMKQGMIVEEGSLFTDICYDITGVESFNRLIAEGYLSPLVSRPTSTQIDVSNLSIVGGEYNSKQAEAVVDTDEITYSAVRETIEKGYDRRSWLVFGAGVKNAEHIAAMLQSFGVPAAASHSKLSDKENDARMAAFERGELRALVGMNKYTTGYDHPAIDLIADLQPTISVGKHVQKGGRGTRIFGGSPIFPGAKTNCLYLDFAGNTRRLGPINDPVKPRKPGKGGSSEMPVRICPDCSMYNHAAARFCGGGSSPDEGKRYGGCGFAFTFKTKIFDTAYTGEILRNDAAIVEYFDVKKVIYNLHEKKDRKSVV